MIKLPSIQNFLAGLTLLFLAFFAQSAPMVSAQSPNIAAGLCTGANLTFTNNPTDNCSTNSDATAKINSIIHDVINTISVIVGIVAVIMIIVGGFRYITSGGSDTGVTGAKNTILYAIIGLIIVALAQVLVRFVLAKVTNS